jgi:hypothetical protein
MRFAATIPTVYRGLIIVLDVVARKAYSRRWFFDMERIRLRQSYGGRDGATASLTGSKGLENMCFCETNPN